MTGWTLFFVVMGVCTITAQVFRIVDAIEAPRKRAQKNAW